MEKKVILNDGGIMFIITMVLVLTFALGFMSAKATGEKTTVFTEEEIEKIITFKNMTFDVDDDTELRVYKDKDGNLMIGWEEVKTKSLFGKK